MNTARKCSRQLGQRRSTGAELTRTPTGGSWLLIYIVIGALLVLSGCRSVPVDHAEAHAQPELSWQVLIIDAASEDSASDTAIDGASTDEADAARAVYLFGQQADASMIEWYLGQDRSATVENEPLHQRLRDYDHFVDVLSSVHLNDDEALLLFVSLDGVPEAGMRPDVARFAGQVVTPRYLGELLEAAVGDQPAVILISADYSGMFAISSSSIESPIIRGSRVVMTSSDARSANARDSAGTIWDRVLVAELNGAHGETGWRDLAVALNRGVTEFEIRSPNGTLSEPQHWVPVRDAEHFNSIFRGLGE